MTIGIAGPGRKAPWQNAVVRIIIAAFVGGICLILGLLTRPVAALFAGFMFVAAFHVHMPIGWFWNARGMELPLYLLLICLAILIHGGGTLSLDRRLGREI